MKIKTRMIGMDLDGTLLKSDKELTQYTKDVLKRAIEQGIIVMPATGRPITECQRNCWNSGHTLCGYCERRKSYRS